MPNWTYNTIYFKDENDFKKAKKVMVTLDKNCTEYVDFEIICPIPKSLCIECSSLTSSIEETENYDSLKEHNKKYLSELLANNNDKMSFEKELIKDSKNEEDLFNKFKQVIEYNKKTYGYKDWYDFSCKERGTKWNACDSKINNKFNEISFDTAWESPKEYLEKLSKNLGSIPLLMISEYEGGALEKITYQNGEMIKQEYFDYYEQYGAEAYLKEVLQVEPTKELIESTYDAEDYWDWRNDKTSQLWDDLYDEGMDDLERLSMRNEIEKEMQFYDWLADHDELNDYDEEDER